MKKLIGMILAPIKAATVTTPVVPVALTPSQTIATVNFYFQNKHFKMVFSN